VQYIPQTSKIDGKAYLYQKGATETLQFSFGVLTWHAYRRWIL